MVTVFRPPPRAAYERELWAPELQRIRGRWYIYFAASDGVNANHRMYALQAAGGNPQGSYVLKGRGDGSDRWAIDGVALELGGKLYFVWSGWPEAKGDCPQVLYIAAMRDPWTIVGTRHLIAAPEHAWERAVAPLLEGPEPLVPRGSMHIVYSAGASWSDDYALGLLSYRGGDPLRASSWLKQPLPVFAKNVDARDFDRPVPIGLPLETPSGTLGVPFETLRSTSAATSASPGGPHPSARRNTSIRLLAGMSKRRSSARPARSATSTTAARRRSPQAGFRWRRSASKATLPKAVGSPSTK